MRLISLVRGDLRVIKLLNTFQKQIGQHLIDSDFSDLEFIHLSNLSNWQYILQIMFQDLQGTLTVLRRWSSGCEPWLLSQRI